MKRFIILINTVGIIFVSQSAKSQYYFENNRYYEKDVLIEAGTSLGIMNSLTDLGGKKGVGKPFLKDYRWKTVRPDFSIYALAMYKYAIALRLEGTFGSVAGYDSILKSVAPSTYGRYERNLSFKSSITELQLALEIHPLFFKNYYDEPQPYFSPYLIVGLGFYAFNPQAKLGDQWYFLHPLHLEGQGFAEYPDQKSYNLQQFNFIAGIGLKYEVSSHFNARLEFVNRSLFTDYLDDASSDHYIDPSLFDKYLSPNLAAVAKQLYNRQTVTNFSSQRGNPKNKDAFFTVQLKLGMVLSRQKR